MSFDDDSGSDYSFSSLSSVPGVSPLHVGSSTALFTEGKSHNCQFVKPKFIAPPSPLATGMQSTGLQTDSKKSSTNSLTYSFTPVKDQC